MIARLALYAAVAGRSFQRYATYRAATLAGVFTNTVFGVIICYTYIALWQQRPTLGGYDVSDALTYAWLGQSLVVTVAIFGMGFQDEFADRVRKGDIAVDLYRPVSLQLWWLASDLGRASFQVAARGIPPTLIGAVLFDLRFPADPLVWIWFVVSVGLAVVVCFGYRYLVGLSAFWLVDSRGLEYLVGVAALFLSGMVLPLVVFPGLARDNRPRASVLGNDPGAQRHLSRQGHRVGSRCGVGIPDRLGDHPAVLWSPDHGTGDPEARGRRWLTLFSTRFADTGCWR